MAWAMQDRRIQLRNPVLAAVLAFLLPGLGHAYQRRFFKACVYGVCILGTFLAGMAMGDWQPVYYRWDSEHSKILSYCTQSMVGLPAMPALVQSRRYKDDCATANPSVLDGETLEAEFLGQIDLGNGPQPVQGDLSLKQLETGVEGEFKYAAEDGGTAALRLSGPITLEQKVYPSSKRGLKCTVVTEDGRRVNAGLSGSIPRSFFDYCEVPLGAPGRPEPLAEVHGRLGKQFDLAAIFTWIAGLLNVLAIWDAFEGPAYGYGDEPEESSGGDKDQEDKPNPDGAAEPKEGQAEESNNA